VPQGRLRHRPFTVGQTAFFASDPNLRHILVAVGYAGIDDLDYGQIDMSLDDVHVGTKGGRHASYREEDGQRVNKQAEIGVRIDRHRGTATTVWSCDRHTTTSA
jgi:glutamate N-acetyltransferase/amino-acid N-acetyltransferase